MINVCPACGQYAVEKEIRPLPGARAEAICPACRHAAPFLRLPLFLVTGASGAGKSRLCLALSRHDRGFLHLETDILWGALPASAEDDYRSYRDAWLRLAKNINQGGRPAVLYGSAVPAQYEACPERRYFGPVHCLALVCREEVLVARLKARPGWRGAGEEAFVQSMRAFNRWFLEQGPSAQPPITLLDTSDLPAEASAAALLDWLNARWRGEDPAGEDPAPENKEGNHDH